MHFKKLILFLLFISPLAFGQNNSLPISKTIKKQALDLLLKSPKKNWQLSKTDSNGLAHYSFIYAAQKIYAQSNNTVLKAKLQQWAANQKEPITDIEQLYNSGRQQNLGLLLSISANKQTTKNAVQWADSLYQNNQANLYTTTSQLSQGMVFWSLLASSQKQDKYFEKLYQLYIYTKNVEGLHSEQDLLWWANSNEKAQNKNTQGRNIIHTRPNAQLVSALACAMANLPAHSSYFNEYGDTFAEMIIAMMNLQENDGLWPNSLSDFTNQAKPKDIVATAYISQAMAWGVANQRLDKDTFMPIIIKAYFALSKAAKSGLKNLSEQAAVLHAFSEISTL
jgi:rhamnogalacturonyl hydrolase YesR